MQFLEERGHGDEKVHIVFIEREAAERIANEKKGIVKPKTRFQMETDDPELYSAYNFQKDRYIRLAGNKTVALSVMLERWADYTDEEITRRAGDE